jgi:hypothetical protein
VLSHNQWQAHHVDRDGRENWHALPKTYENTFETKDVQFSDSDENSAYGDIGMPRVKANPVFRPKIRRTSEQTDQLEATGQFSAGFTTPWRDHNPDGIQETSLPGSVRISPAARRLPQNIVLDEKEINSENSLDFGLSDK